MAKVTIGEWGMGSGDAGHIVCDECDREAVQAAYDAIEEGDSSMDDLAGVYLAGGEYVSEKVTMVFEAVTSYYDRKTRKDVRVVHGTVEAESVDAAHEAAVKRFGDAAAKLTGQTGDYYAKRAIRVKAL